jgi:hypothetical protein
MKVAELVRKANMIIWDEALMMHCRAFEAKPFGPYMI